MDVRQLNKNLKFCCMHELYFSMRFSSADKCIAYSLVTSWAFSYRIKSFGLAILILTSIFCQLFVVKLKAYCTLKKVSWGTIMNCSQNTYTPVKSYWSLLMLLLVLEGKAEGCIFLMFLASAPDTDLALNIFICRCPASSSPPNISTQTSSCGIPSWWATAAALMSP